MTKYVDLTHENKQEFINFCKEFYTSNAVMHPIPDRHIEKTAQLVADGSPYTRCLLFYTDNTCSGYVLLSFTYSNEAGGKVILLEEIYLRDEFRGNGICKDFFSWLFKQYDDEIKRYRLEVSEDNTRVKRLYSSLGFTEFNYQQMVRDL